MQRSLHAADARHQATTYHATAHGLERPEEIISLPGLWAIVPLALGGWTLLVWAALRLLG